MPRRLSGLLARLGRGAALVGFRREREPATVHVYFETSPSLRFADRVRYAAGRCRWFRLDPEAWRLEHPDWPLPLAEYGYVGYPTSLQALVDADELIEAASYDDVLGVVRPLGDQQHAALEAWIGAGEPLEYLASGAVFEARRGGAAGLSQS